MTLIHKVSARTPRVDEQEDFKKDPLARASSFPRVGGGGGCCWCHKKKPGWPGVAVFKIPPQVPLTPGRGLVGGSSDRQDSPVSSDGRLGAAADVTQAQQGRQAQRLAPKGAAWSGSKTRQ